MNYLSYDTLMIMFQKLLLLTLLTIVLSTVTSHAQPSDYPDIKRNGVYLHAVARGNISANGIVSINYERTMGRNCRTNISAGIFSNFSSIVSLPISITRVIKLHKANHFEYGFGAIFQAGQRPFHMGQLMQEFFVDAPSFMFPILYRYQGNSGLFFRAGFDMFIFWPVTFTPAVSLGYKF